MQELKKYKFVMVCNTLRVERYMRMLRGFVIFLGSVGCIAANAYALPFNDDMLTGQLLIPGKVMRPKAPESIAVGGSQREISKTEPYAGTNPNPGDAHAIKRGERLFQVNCKVCHGVIEGGKHTPSELQNYGIPSLNLQGAQGSGKDDQYIFKYVYYGMDAVMPAYGYKLSNAEIWDLVNYIRKLQADNPLPQ